jgi:predicted enzyme related to lactoylglutathione lyase
LIRSVHDRESSNIDFVEFPARSVAELAAAKSFYGEVFGWSFKDRGDDYADTASGGLGCGFNADPEHRPGKTLVVIYSKDLERARAKVLAAGGKVTKEIFSFPGGRRFHFTDPAANELAVWSDE